MGHDSADHGHAIGNLPISAPTVVRLALDAVNLAQTVKYRKRPQRTGNAIGFGQ